MSARLHPARPAARRRAHRGAAASSRHPVGVPGATAARSAPPPPDGVERVVRWLHRDEEAVRLARVKSGMLNAGWLSRGSRLAVSSRPTRQAPRSSSAERHARHDEGRPAEQRTPADVEPVAADGRVGAHAEHRQRRPAPPRRSRTGRAARRQAASAAAPGIGAGEYASSRPNPRPCSASQRAQHRLRRVELGADAPERRPGCVRRLSHASPASRRGAACRRSTAPEGSAATTAAGTGTARRCRRRSPMPTRFMA